MGSSGKDIPLETQFLLLESKDGSPLTPEMELANGDQTGYTVFLPLLEGSFRSSLQGNENEELELCLESGDADVQTKGGLHSVFLHAGTDPFQVIAEAVKAMQMHMQTFKCREEKKIPGILDWFGWCTWDAFYTDISADGVREGLRSLEEGGTPARFIIIDDGWQSVEDERQQFNGEATAGTQFAKRLTDIKENYKFQKDGKDCKTQGDPALGLQHLVHEIKEKHNLKYVYVWHAITGYWGGIKPGAAEMQQYETALKYPIHSPGVLDNQPKISVDSLTVNGLGLADPKKVFQFYNELHSYLAAAGVDGVKVDVQNILETLGAGFGGRVSLTRHYHHALEASVARNFPDNGCIACMSHNTDGLYSIKQTAVVRASDDFWPRDPASHTIHIASVAYNSMFLGEFMQPDWDMFQSLHPAAEYHAAARAIGGCPIYVSDKPGNHDFDLLRRLVLLDGSILRAQLPGRPTRDCLFTDPARDGRSLLKIWNMNKYTGVLGAFNCQGAGWCKEDRRNLIHNSAPVTVTGSVHARDVDFLGKVAPEGWNGDCAIYTHKGGELICLPKSAALPVTLNVLEYELYTASPIKRLTSRAAFAPIGLLKMFNAGGAICTLDYELYEDGSQSELLEKPTNVLNLKNCEVERTQGPIAAIRMNVHGSGEFGVYSSVKPWRCVVNSVSTEFWYEAESGLVTFPLPATKCQLQDVVIEI